MIFIYWRNKPQLELGKQFQLFLFFPWVFQTKPKVFCAKPLPLQILTPVYLQRNLSCLILVPLPLNCQMQFIKTCLVLKRIRGFSFIPNQDISLLAVNRIEPQKDEIQSENFKLWAKRITVLAFPFFFLLLFLFYSQLLLKKKKVRFYRKHIDQLHFNS